MVRVVCRVDLHPYHIAFTWSDGPDSFHPYTLAGQTDDLFREKVATVRDRLRKLVGDYLRGLHDSSEATALEVRQASLELAKAGHELYKRAFMPTEDPGKSAKSARDWLEKLTAHGQVESLEVIAEGSPAVPWNLLYDSKPDEKAFLAGDPECWRPFWAVRHNVVAGMKVNPLRRMAWFTEPSVLLVVDPLVREGLPADQQVRLAAFAADRKLVLIGSVAELDAALAALPNRRPDLLYWLSHASPEALVLGDGDDRKITPKRLHELLEGDGADVPSGLVFLNACRTAEADAAGGSFAEVLFSLRFVGLIATEEQTINTFAAPLGLDFLEAFLDRGESVGTAMRTLRGRVPLGLLYGTYCPPEIRVVRTPAAAEVVKVDTAAPAAGRELGTGDTPATRETVRPLPNHPYRSLQAYGPEDRALFAGRDNDVLRFACVLDDPGTRLLVLHGESGVGKTSFLRAGVVPYLEEECVGYRFARDRSRDGADPILFVRATNDPITQLASALGAFCSRPLVYWTPLKEEVSTDLSAVLTAHVGDRIGRDALRDALRTDTALLGRVLADLARLLPCTPLLVVDQAEEVFTLARTPDDEANRLHFLETLRRATSGPGGFKLVLSLRTEYHGRFVDRLRKGARDNDGVRDYLLTDFGQNDLLDAIRRPTSATPIRYAAEVPADKYQFRYADGVAEEIAGRVRAYTINRHDSVLPLVQVICTQLHALATARPDRTVTLADFDHIGGVEGGMKRHAEELVRQLFPRRADQAAFKRLLSDKKTQLYLRQPDGTLTTALLPADFLARYWIGRTPFNEVLTTAASGDWRLLRVNSLRIGEDDAEKPYVSLGHDALAPVVAGWGEERARWKRLRRVAALVSTVIAVALLMAGLSAFAWKQKDDAEAAKNIAWIKQREAEQAQKRTESVLLETKLREYRAGLSSADAQWKLGEYTQSMSALSRLPQVFEEESAHLQFLLNYQRKRSGLTGELKGHPRSTHPAT